MRNTAQTIDHATVDQRKSSEAAGQQSSASGEFSTASLQLDELLRELSREAGFKTRNGTAQRGNKNRGAVTTREEGARTFLSWEAHDGAKTFGDAPKSQKRGDYFSDAEVEAAKSASSSPKKKVINIEYRPKQRCYSAKVIEKTQTRHEYITEEYLGNKAAAGGKVEGQTSATISIDGRASSIGTISNDPGGRRYHGQRMYSSDVETKVPPIPPPRRHITSPDPTTATAQIIFQANQHQHQDYYSKTLSPASSQQSTTSTLRRGRFETTNSQHLSPPLEVKGISTSSSNAYEEQRWLEGQKRKLERSRYSVDRLTGTTHSGADVGYRSGSLDIDLDDLVQRNLTNKSLAVHQVSGVSRVVEGRDDGKGSYYISGIERPAVRTRLPQTKYIFKITSPDDAEKGSTKKIQKEIFTTHISAPRVPPPPSQPPQNYDSTLKDLETSLKCMLESSLSEKYKEEEKFNKKPNVKAQNDEIISLEPIGPGVQLLEPEVGTLKGQTLRYQDDRTSRIDSKSNSLARHPDSSRTLSPTNLGYGTLPNYPSNQSANVAHYDSFVQHTQQLPQQQQQQKVSSPFQSFQVPGNNATHHSRREAFESVHPSGNQFAQQQYDQQQRHQQQLYQQQQPLQQQFQQALVPQHQKGFAPSPVGTIDGIMGNFKSEQYSSMSYTKTVNNGHLPAPQSLPTSPMLPQKAQETTSFGSQKEISIPITIEGRKTMTKSNNINQSISTNQSEAINTSQLSSSNVNYDQRDYDNSSIATSHISRATEVENIPRQTPTLQDNARVKGATSFEVKSPAGIIGGGYAFEDKQRETYTVVESTGRVSHPGSPETTGSWTISPTSSAKTTNLSSSKAASQSERRNEASNVHITETHSTGQSSIADFEAKQVRDTSNAWHKPHITRQEAIEMLRNKPAGSFVVRNSHNYAGGYGLALKVSHLPPNVQPKGDDYEANLVRHYLVETTPKGVKLKGCSNEPVFPSLSALIHQHSITPLSLPCKLLLPTTEESRYNDTLNQSGTYDFVDDTTTTTTNNNNNNINISTNVAQYTGTINSMTNNNNTASFASNTLSLSETGSQNGPVLYIDSLNTESLTGPEALWKAVGGILEQNWKSPVVTKIDFRISSQGVVLTDSKHRLFFRRHYPLELISFSAIDQSGKIWTLVDDEGSPYSGRVFGFVAKKVGSHMCNSCHLFLEMDPKFSAPSVVGLINNLLH